MNRVVVTGIGAVTPIGNDAQTTWKGMKSGKNGIGFITRFDTEEFKVKVAAEVKDFDPTLYLEKKEIRKTDLYTQYALAAAAQAVEDSGIIGTVEPEPELVAKYEERYQQFRQIYPACKPLFEIIK